MKKKDVITKLVVGCEGGFSKDEQSKFEKDKIVGLILI